MEQHQKCVEESVREVRVVIAAGAHRSFTFVFGATRSRINSSKKLYHEESDCSSCWRKSRTNLKKFHFEVVQIRMRRFAKKIPFFEV